MSSAEKYTVRKIKNKIEEENLTTAAISRNNERPPQFTQ